MAEFVGDIPFMIEVLILGVGLIVLHFNKNENSNHLRWAGRLMAAFGVQGIWIKTESVLAVRIGYEFENSRK